MKVKVLLSIFILSSFGLTMAQIGLNTESPKASFQVSATTATDGTVTEGIIAPILTRTQLIAKDALYGTEQTGAIIYISDISGTPSQKTSLIDWKGYYFFDGTIWNWLGPEPWNKKSGGPAITNNDSIYLRGKVVINGTDIATVHGDNAALSVYGSDASINGLTVGKGSGDIIGNIAIGENALSANTTGNNNIAIGYYALAKNTTGSHNISMGSLATPSLASGDYNISVGYMANNALITGSNNIAIGSQSGFPGGTSNIAIGYKAGSDITGTNNIAIGALSRIISGSNNIVIGNVASINGSGTTFNIAIGDSVTVEGNYNIAIGKRSQVRGTNSVALGYSSINNTNNSIVLGSSQVNTIRAAVTSITALSDRRVKKDIRENVPGLAFINKLSPVTYNINVSAIASLQQIPDTINTQRKLEMERILHTGFIAQQVEKAARDINYDFDGVYIPQNSNEIYGVNYTSFIPSLIKAVQEQKEQIEEQEQFIEEQKLNIQKQDILVQGLRKRLAALEAK